MSIDDENLHSKYGHHIKVYNKYYHYPKPNLNKTKKHSFSLSNDWNKSKKKNQMVTDKISRHHDKVLVFDLDETLGSFSELQWIWTTIMEHYSANFVDYKIKITPLYVLQTLLEIYPEFLRPGILHIMDYVARRKKQGDCMGIFLYTNNQSSSVWIDVVVEYFNHELQNRNNIPIFFDQVIQAFKIGTQKIEMNRTTQMKTHNDLIRCTLLPNETEICFIDNSKYQYMKHPKVFYIQPRSYYHMMSIQEIKERFVFAETSGILNDFYPFLIHEKKPALFSSFLFSNPHSKNTNHQMKQFIEKTMDEYVLVRGLNKNSNQTSNEYNENIENIDIDIYVSDTIMRFIREFFVMTTYQIENKKPNSEMQKTMKKPFHTKYFSDGFTGIYYCT